MKKRALVALTALLTVSQAMALDGYDLIKLEGYTLIEVTKVSGTFNGSKIGDVVKLMNGKVFEFRSYNYTYAYAPDTGIFAKLVGDTVIYKLLIQDKVYDVVRLR